MKSSIFAWHLLQKPFKVGIISIFNLLIMEAAVSAICGLDSEHGQAAYPDFSYVSPARSIRELSSDSHVPVGQAIKGFTE